MTVGDSLAVDGTCLTLTETERGIAVFHYSPETGKSTIISTYHPGTRVNLEMPLLADSRLHGHLVQGHVDCVGQVLKKNIVKGDSVFWFSFPQKNEAMVVEKGSIAVNGISLTIVSAERGKFSVVVIPETFENTNAGKFLPGKKVNLEFDIIGKYVLKQTNILNGQKKLRNYLDE